MADSDWGEWIGHDGGKRPDWLGREHDKEIIRFWSKSVAIVPLYNMVMFAHWHDIRQFALRADHPYYRRETMEDNQTPPAWGDLITHDGRSPRPAWISDDQVIRILGYRRPTMKFARDTNWAEGFSYMLPADHWAYEPLSIGFTPWAGGPDAPADWDGEAVLHRDGVVVKRFSGDWNWNVPQKGPEGALLPGDIIGYRRKAIDTPRTHEAANASRCDRIAQEPSPLVEFFRSPEGDEMGRKGDYEGWSTEETAVHYLRKYVVTAPVIDNVSNSCDRLRRLAETLHAKHFPGHKDWTAGHNIPLLIAQIDNMTAGLRWPEPPAAAAPCNGMNSETIATLTALRDKLHNARKGGLHELQLLQVIRDAINILAALLPPPPVDPVEAKARELHSVTFPDGDFDYADEVAQEGFRRLARHIMDQGA